MLVCKDVVKEYDGFTLDRISFELPKGCIMGLIGENGAGKSTLITSILGSTIKNSGHIEIFGKDFSKLSKDEREDIGVVLSESSLNQLFSLRDVNTIMKSMYRKWDEKYFFDLCDEYSLKPNKTIKEFSKGMVMKLNIVIALAHHPRLLIMDEPTSGLDPVARDELLDIFFDFVKDGEHAILISSHILSDLEKICDSITFISKGKVLLSEYKDEIYDKYCIIRCNQENLSLIDPNDILGIRKNTYGIEVCIIKDKCPDNLQYDNASLEDIMVYASKGVK